MVGATFKLPRGVSMNLFGRAESGIPFTPLVSGDENADGIS